VLLQYQKPSKRDFTGITGKDKLVYPSHTKEAEFKFEPLVIYIALSRRVFVAFVVIFIKAFG